MNAAEKRGGERPKGRVLQGRVLSAAMDKTITVLVERRVKHPLYKKVLQRSAKIHAHDEDNSCAEGDWVTIGESRPYSKTKAFRLLSIDEKGQKGAGDGAAETAGRGAGRGADETAGEGAAEGSAAQ